MGVAVEHDQGDSSVFKARYVVIPLVFTLLCFVGFVYYQNTYTSEQDKYVEKVLIGKVTDFAVARKTLLALGFEAGEAWSREEYEQVNQYSSYEESHSWAKQDGEIFEIYLFRRSRPFVLYDEFHRITIQRVGNRIVNACRS